MHRRDTGKLLSINVDPAIVKVELVSVVCGKSVANDYCFSSPTRTYLTTH